MRYCGWLVILVGLAISSLAQNDAEGPTNEKAQKTYRQGLDYMQQHMTVAALDSFKKADKQDDGHCLLCQKKLQDQHIGDAAIEGKLKKLVGRARELQAAETPKQ